MIWMSVASIVAVPEATSRGSALTATPLAAGTRCWGRITISSPGLSSESDRFLPAMWSRVAGATRTRLPSSSTISPLAGSARRTVLIRG